MSASRRSAIDRIVETTVYLNTESRRLAREQCAKHGITATQLNVLKLLQTISSGPPRGGPPSGGDLSLSELSRRMSAKNSTITGIIDRMVEAELVEREQSAEDRRVWMIKLTPRGKAMAKKLDVAPWEILRSAVMALPPAELEQLTAILLKIVDHVEKTVKETSK
jgi:DNA-binding MarR family transcriptional regulator